MINNNPPISKMEITETKTNELTTIFLKSGKWYNPTNLPKNIQLK